MLDDTCATTHAETDADKTLNQRLSSLKAHKPFTHRADGFSIEHYAGHVSYTLQGMVEKNKDLLVPDLLSLFVQTNNPFVRELFSEYTEETVSSASRIRTATASNRIKVGYRWKWSGCSDNHRDPLLQQSCNNLVDALMAAMPHYIRCIKPNDAKAPNLYDDRICLHQIKYLGLLENIRIRRSGYAYRQTFQNFLQRYDGYVANRHLKNFFMGLFLPPRLIA